MSIATFTTKSDPLEVTPSITDLLWRAGNGDPSAWEEIVRRYHALVLAKVRSFRLQEADAQDAVQMTWLQLAENCHRIRCPESLGGWLATTATRECLHILRRTMRIAPGLPESAEPMVEQSVGPEQRAMHAETLRALRRLLAELSPQRRQLLGVLFSEDPPSYAELARTSGIPIGSIGPTRARTLRQLRRSLKEHGIGPGDDRP